MKTVLNIYKPLAKTPLEMIHLLKKQKEYANLSMTYAGRLDPLAHGVLLIVVDEAIKEKERYLNLPKVYEFQALLGVSTDTYDILGLLQPQENISREINVNSIVNEYVNKALNMSSQTYPPFSSKAVQGKPLFQWAKENRLEEIEIPKRDISITQFALIDTKFIGKEALKDRIFDNIDSVHGDFRQDDIKNHWRIFFETTYQTKYQIIKCKVSCSSGTYIRGLINDLGNELGCGAIALDIFRTSVGKYNVSESMKVAD